MNVQDNEALTGSCKELENRCRDLEAATESERAAAAAARQEAAELVAVSSTRDKENKERVTKLQEQASLLGEEVCIVRFDVPLFSPDGLLIWGSGGC